MANGVKVRYKCERSGVKVRVRAGGGMRYLRTEKLRSFYIRPFIVLTMTKRAHYKAERERQRAAFGLGLGLGLGLGGGSSSTYPVSVDVGLLGQGAAPEWLWLG